jgi:hypothetical protein
MVERAGEAAELGFKAHPHMLRHACGFALANKGHDTRRCRAISAIRTSSIRCATPSCHRIASRTSGANRRCKGHSLHPVDGPLVSDGGRPCRWGFRPYHRCPYRYCHAQTSQLRRK